MDEERDTVSSLVENICPQEEEILLGNLYSAIDDLQTRQDLLIEEIYESELRMSELLLEKKKHSPLVDYQPLESREVMRQKIQNELEANAIVLQIGTTTDGTTMNQRRMKTNSTY